VKALVEATPISGPARIGSATSLSRAIDESGDVDDRDDPSGLAPAIAQRGQRVGGLARLADDDCQRALGDRRLAVAEFRGDIDVDRYAGKPLDPVFRRQAGKIGRATRDHGDAVDRGEVDPAAGQRNRLAVGA